MLIRRWSGNYSENTRRSVNKHKNIELWVKNKYEKNKRTEDRERRKEGFVVESWWRKDKTNNLTVRIEE